MGLAVCVSVLTPFDRSALWKTTAASHGRRNFAERIEAGGRCGGNRQTRQLPQPAAFLCHASAHARLRHSHGAGVVRPQRREHDDDLYARAEQAGCGRAQSARPRAQRLSREAARLFQLVSRDFELVAVWIAKVNGVRNFVVLEFEFDAARLKLLLCLEKIFPARTKSEMQHADLVVRR